MLQQEVCLLSQQKTSPRGHGSWCTEDIYSAATEDMSPEGKNDTPEQHVVSNRVPKNILNCFSTSRREQCPDAHSPGYVHRVRAFE